jgi:proline iminopeptidase
MGRSRGLVGRDACPRGYQPHLGVRELSWQVVFARLVTHYWGHGCFPAHNEILANIGRSLHIPATLVHGLHDTSGPLDTAWELHKPWPASRLVIVSDAGRFGGSMGDQFSAAIDSIGAPLRPA